MKRNLTEKKRGFEKWFTELKRSTTIQFYLKLI